MPTAIDGIVASIKKFQAENATMGEGDDNSLPGSGTSHAPCYKTYRESMSALIKIWKAKVTKLKALKDPKPEYNAAKEMQVTFTNVQNSLQNCLKMPLHKVKTPGPGDRF
jgi:hypothetical protein